MYEHEGKGGDGHGKIKFCKRNERKGGSRAGGQSEREEVGQGDSQKGRK